VNARPDCGRSKTAFVRLIMVCAGVRTDVIGDRFAPAIRRPK
jgi:hypothetical protein